jgi:hypothetical protein
MSDEKLFTAEEANASLDELREVLPRLREARRALISAGKRITERVANDGGGVEGRDYFDARRILKEDVERLAAAGILLRDPESGLVDFPAEREGRRVFLCWRLGEESVGWYHDVEAGFVGRKPL